MMMTQNPHPVETWLEDARQTPSVETGLRLAAMAGHMQRDSVAARRAALIDVLADGQPHPREALWAAVAARLGQDCWGAVPREALARDLRALRQGGLRIDYSRRPGIIGYYLAHPPLKRQTGPRYDAVNWVLVKAIQGLTPAEKNTRAFAAADFALQQKMRLLAAAHPDWPPGQVALTARRQVYGVDAPLAETADVDL